MDTTVDIDVIDDLILHLLLKDAQIGLKEISEKCGISSVAAFKRINRLKKLGVITGSTLFTPLEIYDYKIIAFIEIETEIKADPNEILKFFREHTCLIEPSLSIGKYDLHALIYAKDFDQLNGIVEMIKRRSGIRKVTVYVWSGLPSLNYDNLHFMPKVEK
jgi:Lrp/AsnC family leucine-responsive transcriptional regulator